MVADASEKYAASNFRVQICRFKNRLGDTGNLQGRWSWDPRGEDKETQSEPMGRNNTRSFVHFFPLFRNGFLPLSLPLGSLCNHLSNSSI
jgi:hypothetical protein